jgi:hypothetical protein
MPQTHQINLSDADFNAALVTAIRLRGCDLLHGLPVEDVSPLNDSLLIRVNISPISGFAGYDGTWYNRLPQLPPQPQPEPEPEPQPRYKLRPR